MFNFFQKLTVTLNSYINGFEASCIMYLNYVLSTLLARYEKDVVAWRANNVVTTSGCDVVIRSGPDVTQLRANNVIKT